MAQIHRLLPLLLLMAFASASWSQETPPEAKSAEPGKDAAPKFSATLLLIKSDWSKSPHAKEIEAELREALKDASVPKELLDKLPGSGPQILFAPEIVSLYSSEHFAELMAWLKARELVMAEDSFEQVKTLTKTQSEFRANIAKSMISQYDKNQNGKLEKEEWQITYDATTEAGRVADIDKDDVISPEEFEAASIAEAERQVRNTRVIKREDTFIELPRPKAQRDQPFVMRRPELTWSVAWRDTSSIRGIRPMSYTLSRTRTFFEQARGAAKPEHPNMVDSCSLGFNLPDNHVAIANAFPAKTEQNYRFAARKKGFEAVVVVAAAVTRVDQQPRLHLPDWIEVTPIQHEVQGQRLAYMGLPPETFAFQETTSTKIFHLRNASAAESRNTLQQLAPLDIKLAVDERTNSIIVSGAEEKLAELEAIVKRLDEAESAADNSRPAPQPAESIAALKQQYAAAEQEAARLAKESKPAKDKLHAAVARAFELRQKLLQAELVEFRQRTERIEQSLKQREGIKQQIIERRVEDLLKPGLEWE